MSKGIKQIIRPSKRRNIQIEIALNNTQIQWKTYKYQRKTHFHQIKQTETTERPNEGINEAE